MRLIDADALYAKVQEGEELARKRVLDTETTLPCPTNLNPAYTRYSAQMDERTKLKHMIADAPTIEERKTGRWTDCSTPPDDDRNVFIVRGKDDFMSVCIGHYDHDSKLWYEDRNWFAKLMYDEMFWTEIPGLPTMAKMEVEHEAD